jgi:hypothetical protein
MSRTPPQNTSLSNGQLPPWLIFASYALLVAAWVVGNPPPGAADEWSHYLRAVSLGHGQLLGIHSGREGAMAIVGSTRPPFLDEKTYQDQLAILAQNTRKVRIPAGLTPGWFRCAQQTDPLVPARCVMNALPLDQPAEWFNQTATYQPFPYLVPAAISSLDASPDNLDRLMRAGKAFVSLAFVAATVFLLWNAQSRLVSLVGVIVAITPMMVFLSATLNPSGLEIASALAFAAALLRLTRDGAGGTQRWHWVAFAASGAALSLSRTQGPVWVVLLLVIVVTSRPPSAFLRLFVEEKRQIWRAAIVVLIGIVLNRFWEYAYGPRLAFDPWPLVSSVSEGFRQLPEVLREQVGVFNYLEVSMPRLAYGLWGVLVVALTTTALLVGSSWQRLHLLASIGAALAVPVLLVATTMRHTGFGLQGRYVLSFSLVVPLLAGEILVRRHDRLRALDAEHLFFPFALGAGFVQLVAWWTNARRFAVGMRGPWWFLPAAEWSPPMGWWPWLVLAVAGACLLIATALLDRLLSRRPNDLGPSLSTVLASPVDREVRPAHHNSPVRSILKRHGRA